MHPIVSKMALGLSLILGLVGTTVQARPTAVPLARHAMVAAANPHAVEAGLAVLRAGGSAADAAVAVQSVLGLVEPQSSGLGGGAFLTYFDARTRILTAYNGRETAPAAASATLFLGEDGQPLSFFPAVLSGRSTGVPGAVAMLALAHKQHGQRPWASCSRMPNGWPARDSRSAPD